jgi:hypothetical protein
VALQQLPLFGERVPLGDAPGNRAAASAHVPGEDAEPEWSDEGLSCDSHLAAILVVE